MQILDNQILVKCYGGSRMYGLETPTSDIDIRFIYKFNDFNLFAGLDSNTNSHVQDKEDGKDDEGKEFRHYLRLLRGGNTQMLELLFNENWIKGYNLWKYIQNFRNKLIDPCKLFKSILGYGAGELKLATGKRTGKIGGKRKAQIDEFGFSPKNFANLLRIYWCGIKFFNTGIYPTCLKQEECYDLLMSIKINPYRFNKEQLVSYVENYESKLKIAFNTSQIKNNYCFDVDTANDLIGYVYYELMCKEV